MSHSHRNSLSRSAKKELAMWAVLLFAAVAFSFSASTNASTPFTSSEVHFADSSKSGLSIVPASCESGIAHESFMYNGVFTTECSCPAGTTFTSTPNPTFPLAPYLTCTPNVCTGTDPANATMCTGDSSGLSANTAKTVATACGTPKCEFTCNSGFVKSGNTCVPAVCTGSDPANATMCSGDNTGLSADTAKTVAAACGVPKCEFTCNSGYLISGNTCVQSCPAGQVWNGSACVSACPAGQTWNGSACVSSCPTGQVWNGSACVLTCPEGQTWNGSACVAMCTSGQVWDGTACVTPQFSCTGSIPSNSALCASDNLGLTSDTPRTLAASCGAPKCEYLCNGGYVKSGNTCVATCPSGEIWNGSTCVTSCPTGQTWNGTSCVPICTGGQVWNGSACVCPSGQTWNGSMCVGSCADTYFCQGNSLYHQSASCENTLSQTCSYGCSAGACNAQPAGNIDFVVTPLLVRKGETAQATWSTINITSCTVTSTNGAAWSGTSGTEVSAPINAQTVFTIRCNSNTGSVITKTATVNIIPTFCEAGSPGC